MLQKRGQCRRRLRGEHPPNTSTSIKMVEASRADALRHVKPVQAGSHSCPPLDAATRACLNWFDVPERVKYKVIILTRRCLIGTVPRYLGLAADRVPVFEMVQRRHLRSATGHQLIVPSYRLNSSGLRAFSVLGPRLWNSLPIDCCVTLATTLPALDIL